jgi:membrane protease subunit HflC
MKSNNAFPLSGLFLLAGALLMTSSNFILLEGQQAVVTQFGRPVGKPKTEAGFYWKLPLVQSVQFVEKRLLTWDGYTNQIPTLDKKYIIVDTTARWQIVDALQFIKTLQNETGATGRLNAILDAITRDVISDHNLVEAVRNSNTILDYIRDKNAESERKVATGELLVAEEEQVTGEIEKIHVGRERLSEMIAQRAHQEVTAYGLKIIDVQLRRIAYEGSVEQKVYDRMISERKRIAEKIRSIGKGEQAKIQGTRSRDLQRINSEAYCKAQRVRGQAEAEASTIYAKALSQDKAFYTFTRSLDAYRKALSANSQLILSTDTEFLRFFKQAPQAQ